MEFTTMEFMFLEQRIKRAVCDKGTDKKGTDKKGKDKGKDNVKLRPNEVQEEKEEEPIIPPLDISVSKDWVFKTKFADQTAERRIRDYKNTSIFRGPTHESNWLLFKTPGYKMGALAVGGYPDSTECLDALLDAGLETFVNLCEEYGTREYPAYAANKIKFPDGSFLNEPIQDMNTTDDIKIDRLAAQVVERLVNGENVYIHCAGGHGRTGTLASLVLNKLYPRLSLDDIFEYLQFAHDQRDGNFPYKLFIHKMMNDPMAFHMSCGQVPTPQTLKQRNQVRRILNVAEIPDK